MRYVKLTKDQFDHYVFPSLGRTAAESEDELEVSVRLLGKFRDPNVIEIGQPSAAELAEAKEKKGRVIPNRFLIPDEHTFEFEEDEHRVLLKRFRAAIPTFAAVLAEEVYAVLNVLKDPPNKPMQIVRDDERESSGS